MSPCNTGAPRPAACRWRPSSSGVTNRSHWCVPTGSQRSTYSAPDDGQQVRLGRAVDGGEQHQPAGPHQRRADLEKSAHVRHMLHHLQAGHGIERAAFRHQVLDARRAIVDVEVLAGGVPAGRLDVLRRRVESRHAPRRAAPAARTPGRRRIPRRESRALPKAASPHPGRCRNAAISWSRRNVSRAGPI